MQTKITKVALTGVFVTLDTDLEARVGCEEITECVTLGDYGNVVLTEQSFKQLDLHELAAVASWVAYAQALANLPAHMLDTKGGE